MAATKPSVKTVFFIKLSFRIKSGFVVSLVFVFELKPKIQRSNQGVTGKRGRV